MYRPSYRGVVATLSSKLPRYGLGTAVFGARLLIAFALPSHVLAQEAHSAAQPAAAVRVSMQPRSGKTLTTRRVMAAAIYHGLRLHNL